MALSAAELQALSADICYSASRQVIEEIEKWGRLSSSSVSYGFCI
ncbi:hypothetical protein ATN83_0855 [Raoultella ornithinolytica]|nr:hypothetical protein ATN83_0855 [Raoultella ornithinolytica]KDV91789.1 hypothetical protein AB00_4018 [Raoultella ornithinolytica 2-156-04_S1_C1]KDX12001.1 hypothetical protein AB28_4019 [Raoultella ornithinolytica 2-156-04_S1_C2]